MDAIIHITDLTLPVLVGVTNAERGLPQTVVINIQCTVDVTAALESDNLTDTLDYAAVVAACTDIARERRFHLLETLANAIADACFAHSCVRSATVRVEKPRKLPNIAAAGVTIERHRAVEPNTEVQQ